MNKITMIYMLLLTFIMMSCKDADNHKKKLEIDYENMPPQELAIKSYNEALFGIDTSDFENEIKAIQSDYTLFLGDKSLDMMSLNFIRNFITDTFCIRLNDEVERKFEDKTALTEDIKAVYQRLSYYYPMIELPQPYFYVSGIDYETPPVMLAENGIAISLDYYLGVNDRIYDYIGMPRFRSVRCHPSYVPRDLAQSIYQAFLYRQHNQKDVLTEMIHSGKMYYFMEAMNPHLPDSVLMGYSSKQMQWIQNNEGNVWASVVGNDMLYAKGLDAYRNFFGDGPFTQAFSDEAPARLGEYLGLQIVRSYMTNNEVSLQELMANDDVQQIFQESFYKPRKE